MNSTRIIISPKSVLHRFIVRLTCRRSKIQIRTFASQQDGKPPLYKLNSRSLVQVMGKDSFNFLQGLITSDVNLMNETNMSQYAMMLNVQGRVLYDLLLYNMSTTEGVPTIWMECATAVKEELIQTMNKYKIRKKVDISDISSTSHVYSTPGKENMKLEKFIDVCIPDPRLPDLGSRILTSKDLTSNLDYVCLNEESYHEHRYKNGIGEGIVDLPPGNCFPLENNLIFLNGVSFDKGCYIGQELTARTFHTGVTRKRLMPVLFENVPSGINPDTAIVSEKGKSAGKLRSYINKYGLGLVRVAASQGDLSLTDTTGSKLRLKAEIPSWWPSQNHML